MNHTRESLFFIILIMLVIGCENKPEVKKIKTHPHYLGEIKDVSLHVGHGAFPVDYVTITLTDERKYIIKALNCGTGMDLYRAHSEGYYVKKRNRKEQK